MPILWGEYTTALRFLIIQTNPNDNDMRDVRKCKIGVLINKSKNSPCSNTAEGVFLAMRNFVLFLISMRTMDNLSLLRLLSRELLQ